MTPRQEWSLYFGLLFLVGFVGFVLATVLMEAMR